MSVDNSTVKKMKAILVPHPQAEAEQNCCRPTLDGQTVCLVPTARQTESSGSLRSDSAHATARKRPLGFRLLAKVRGWVMPGLACLTSPCCTPLYVPLILILLAGTPAAVWLSAHIGWVYGSLTLLSLLAFVLSWRWLKQPHQNRK